MSLFASKQQQLIECHFCCQTTTTPIYYKHGWLCPDSSCAQYNGFTVDGDYNLDLVQEFVSQSPNTNHRRPSYCSPSQVPFQIPQNGFCHNTDLHSSSSSSSSAAPLCHACQQNIHHTQQKLRAFDAGPNSTYSAYLEYQQLLQEQYPLCRQCQTQCNQKLNTINQTARLWQQYEAALPPNNLDAFRVPSQASILKPHRVHKTNLCCSSFITCVIQSMIVYLSCHTSMNGATALCERYLSTPQTMLQNCDIQTQGIGIRTTCDGASDYSTLCLLVHFIGNQMASYALISDPLVLALLSLLLLYYSYDGHKYNRLFVALFVIANVSLIIIDGLLLPSQWMQFVWYSDEIYVAMQMGMFLVVVLMLTCSYGTPPPRVRAQRMHETQKKSSDVLTWLEQQEKLDNVRCDPLLFDVQRSSQSMQEHQPFFPSFTNNSGVRAQSRNHMAQHWNNVNDPFEKKTNHHHQQQQQQHGYTHNAHTPHTRIQNHALSVSGLSAEPMDVCTPSFRRHHSPFHSVGKRMNNLQI